MCGRGVFALPQRATYSLRDELTVTAMRAVHLVGDAFAPCHLAERYTRRPSRRQGVRQTRARGPSDHDSTSISHAARVSARNRGRTSRP
jgi:hypothetical protein